MNDGTTRFSNRAEDYAKYRPTYPREIIDAILDGFVEPSVADLGAGTGISARLLADAGARVFAVEPNAAMRSAIPARGKVTIVNGTAEATALPDASIDIITAFQAYHWFNAGSVLAEAARITKSRSRFAAVWNHRDRDDQFTGAFEAIVDRYDTTGGAADRSRRSGTVFSDLERADWKNVRKISESHEHPLNFEAMLGFVRSASYLPREGDEYEAMVAELRRLYDRQAARNPVRFIWKTEAFIGDRYD